MFGLSPDFINVLELLTIRISNFACLRGKIPEGVKLKGT